MRTYSRFIFLVLACVSCSRAALSQTAANSTWEVRKLAFERGSVRVGVTPRQILNPDLVVIEHADGKSRAVAEGLSPTWSPDGDKLAFCVHEGRGFGQIYVVNADGSGKNELTKLKGGASDPDWSPDGEKLVFTVLEFGTPKLGIIRKNGEGLTKLTDGYQARWSPNGKQLLFSRPERQGASTSIWVINSDGAGLQKVTEDDSAVIETSWMPDGSGIVFASKRNRRDYAIYRINLDGTGFGILAEDKSASFYFPLLSPDGKQLIVDAYPKEGGQGDLVLLDLVTHKKKTLTHGHHPAVLWGKNP